MAFFEVRYLEITWQNRDEVLKVNFSDHPLVLEPVEKGYEVETVTYTQAHHVIGIHIPNKTIDSEVPYFLLANGEREYLSPVIIPGTDHIWWIQKSYWSSENKKWYSDTYRTAGRYEIQIEHTTLMIINNTSNFTIEELEYYLKDFKNNLWMLILDNKSVAKINIEKEEKSPSIFNQEFLELLDSYLKGLEQVLLKPTMHLNEMQAKKPLRAVKPLPRTFREIAINPTAKMLTSRAFYESYDTPENRYVYYTLTRVLFLVKSLNRISKSQIEIFQQKLLEIDKSIHYYETLEYKVVDQNVYDNEIRKLRSDLMSIKEAFILDDNIVFEENDKEFTYIVHIENAYGAGDKATHASSFFVKELMTSKNETKFQKPSNSIDPFCVITFPKKVLIKDFSKAKIEITAVGKRSRKKTNKSGREYFLLKIKTIRNLLIHEHIYLKQYRTLLKNRKYLSQNNWEVELTKEEIEDRDRELKTLRYQKEMIGELMNDLEAFLTKIPVIEKELIHKLSFFKQYKVKQQSHCPNSMVFIQNPSYVTVKSCYQKISQFQGLSEALLEGLMQVEQIGLVSVPDLYERWCLMQILKVLTNVYNFSLEDDWEGKLVNLILHRDYNIELLMRNTRRHQEILLTYEKVLPSGKRPDYVLDLHSFGDYGISSRYDRYGFSNDHSKARLVLDAKFRSNLPEEEILKVVEELYHEKNYSENGKNQVFVIHPVQNSISHTRTSPLEWGNSCNYGQAQQHLDENMESVENISTESSGISEDEQYWNEDDDVDDFEVSEEEDVAPQHRYGHIFLSPSLKYSRSIDNLQRLLGAFLQRNAKYDSDSEGIISNHSFCCIACGNDSPETFIVNKTRTRGNNPRYTLECQKCSSFSVKTVCYACPVDDLFKNGFKWTYHRTRAEQVSNIVCYKCEKFL